MEWLVMKRWLPELVGAAIGVLSWLAFLLADRPIGVSTAFSETTGMIERLFRGDEVFRNPHYKKVVPHIDGTWVLVVGLFIGAFVSAQLSGSFQWHWVPNLWSSAFGTAPLPRFIAALAGGILVGIGSRWADGCTSGHGISGLLQMSIASMIAVLCFFIGGIATAMVIFSFFAR